MSANGPLFCNDDFLANAKTVAPLGVAIIGCGAVAQQFYIPALQEVEKLGIGYVKALFDSSQQNADRLQRSFPSAKQIQHFSQLQEVGVNLAIIASPPAMHCAQTVECLRSGISVLCEKPMTASLYEAQIMVQEAQIAAGTSGALLAIGHYKRLLPAAKLIAEIIKTGILGKLRAFQILEGGVFNWPVKSAALFKKDQAAGGVLIDTGVHVLDLINWWLGLPSSVAYEDDAMGGIEANCRLRLEYERETWAFSGDIKLSRDFAAPNYYCFEFDNAIVNWQPTKANELDVQWKNMHHVVNLSPVECLSMEQCFTLQLLNVISAVKIAQANRILAGKSAGSGAASIPLTLASASNAPSYVSALDALHNMELIDTCYKNRKLIQMPWLSQTELDSARKLALDAEVTTSVQRSEALPIVKPVSKIKVAVLGASGFIGSRIVEMLNLGVSFEPNNQEVKKGNYEVVPVLRGFASLARMSRFELNARIVNDFNEDELLAAFTDCSYVINAIGGDAGVYLDSIEPIYSAAQGAKVSRIIYISSAAVHGQAPEPGCDETSSLSKDQHCSYNNVRVEAEERLLRLSQSGSTELVILRPGIVYGPRSRRWTADIADELMNGRAVLLNEGLGICNSIYVDNLVQAVILSMNAQARSCDGKAYIVSDKEKVTWRDMYLSISRALDPTKISITSLPFDKESLSSLIETDTDPISKVRSSPVSRAILPFLSGQFKRAVKAFIYSLQDNKLPSRWQVPISLLAPLNRNVVPKLSYEIASLQLCEYKLPINRAKQDLGYEPHVSFRMAQQNTCEWLAFAGYPVVDSPQDFDFSVTDI